MSLIGNLFGKKKGTSVLGIDIGSSSLKVVQLREERGVVVLETYGELALGPYGKAAVGQATNLPADTIAKTLKDLIREANVTTVDCGVSIPASRSLLAFVELPKRDSQEEQKTIIELEARKYIPVPVSEVQLDWFILPTSKEKDATKKPVVQVLLVAVHNDEIKLLENVVTGAGVEATFYEIEIFSTIRSVVDEPTKPVMIIDIGAGSTKVYVVEQNVVGLSHAIPHGGQDVTRAIAATSGVDVSHAEQTKKKVGFTEIDKDNLQESMESVYSNIFGEAHRVLSQFEIEHHRAVATIVLTGGGGVTKGLSNYAKRFFAVETRVADPFAKVQAPAFMRPVLQEIGPEFSVAVGIALRKLSEHS